MRHAIDVLLRSKKRRAREQLAAGRAAEARALLEPVCARYPRDPEIWCLLGQAQGEAGAWQQAHDSLQNAEALAPGEPVVQFFLANALLTLGRPGEADPHYRRALERNPRWPQALSNLGRALQLEGRDVEAIDCFERALALDPHLGKALYNLGLSHRRCGRLVEAAGCFRRALAQHPDSTELQRVLAQTLADVGQLEQAEGYLHRVLRTEPDAVDVWCELGMIHRLQGHFDRSLDAYRRAQTLAPEHAGAHAGEAAVLEMLGRRDEAARIVRAQVDRGDCTADTLEVYAVLARDSGACGEALTLLRQRLDIGNLPGDGRTRLLFRLGRLHERLGEHDRAFAAWAEANRLVNVRFDREAHGRFVDAIIGTFTREAFARLPRSRRTAPGPVFIVGMPRSGTSLTEQILASHSRVYGAGELPWIPRLADSMAAGVGDARAFPVCLRGMNLEALDRLAEEYLRSSPTDVGGALYVTDKLPVNFHYLGLIALLLPGARIIHCARDPRDTALSIFAQYFGLRIPFAYRLEDIAAFYREYVRLMCHWEAVLPLPLHTVHYEALASNPEPIIRGLISFLGLDWESACLAPHRSKRVIATASYDQVRVPIHAGAIGRWRRYESHLGELVAALGDACPEGS